MAVKEEIRWFEQMLKTISSHQVWDGQIIKDFASRYGLDLKTEESLRPVIKGTSTAAVIREVREGRWRRYT